MGRCMSYVDVGFDNDFQPVTFSLAPGHWIRLEDSSEQAVASRPASSTTAKRAASKCLCLNMAAVRFCPSP